VNSTNVTSQLYCGEEDDDELEDDGEGFSRVGHTVGIQLSAPEKLLFILAMSSSSFSRATSGQQDIVRLIRYDIMIHHIDED
jgi:hypothetical protein